MPEHETERRCILTGEHGTRDGLIRLALGPDGVVLPDLAARAPGRGAWIVPNGAVVREAQAKGKLKGALARAFKSNSVRAPDDIAGLIEDGLRRRALDRLGLENRAGHLILGFDRIADAIAAGRVMLLLHAADAAADGAAKLSNKLRASRRQAPIMAVPATRADLSLALGRENVVHAAVCDQAAALRVAAAVERWRAFCGMRDDGAGTQQAVSDEARYQGQA